MQTLLNWGASIAARKQQCALLKQQEQDLQTKQDDLRMETLEQASLVLQQFSQTQRNIAAKNMERLCTLALQYALDPRYEARIEMKQLRGKPAATLQIYDNKTGIATSPVSSNGGGVVDIVSTALRYIILETWPEFIDGPIILDEAYKHLSKEYTPAVASFLKRMTDDFGRQTILSTHNDYIAQSADQKIHVSLNADGMSQVEVSV